MSLQNKNLLQDWIKYRDRIPSRKFRPQEDQGRPPRKRSSSQLYRNKQPVYVWIDQPTGWEIKYPVLSQRLLGFGFCPSGSSCGTSSHKRTTVLYLIRLLSLIRGGVSVGASFRFWFTIWSILVLLVTLRSCLP